MTLIIANGIVKMERQENKSVKWKGQNTTQSLWCVCLCLSSCVISSCVSLLPHPRVRRVPIVHRKSKQMHNVALRKSKQNPPDSKAPKCIPLLLVHHLQSVHRSNFTVLSVYFNGEREYNRHLHKFCRCAGSALLPLRLPMPCVVRFVYTRLLVDRFVSKVSWL